MLRGFTAIISDSAMCKETKCTHNNRRLATLVEKPPVRANVSTTLAAPWRPGSANLLKIKDQMSLPCPPAETGMRDPLRQDHRTYRNNLVLEQSDPSIPKKVQH